MPFPEHEKRQIGACAQPYLLGRVGRKTQIATLQVLAAGFPSIPRAATHNDAGFRMNTIRSAVVLCLVALFTVSCATTQSRYSILGDSYPPKPEGYDVQVFRDEAPQQPFVRISRLDVHLEKTHFIGSSFDDALPELKKQARLSGADAIIEIRERSSMVGETRIYHVTATGIRYTDSQ